MLDGEQRIVAKGRVPVFELAESSDDDKAESSSESLGSEVEGALKESPLPSTVGKRARFPSVTPKKVKTEIPAASTVPPKPTSGVRSRSASRSESADVPDKKYAFQRANEVIAWEAVKSEPTE